MSAAPAPSAALLIIGAEVLAGKVEDQNGPFLIRALRGRGIEVVELRVIGDEVGAIAAAVNALRPATYVLTTGGIGPTHDDVTIAGVAAAFGRPVVRHPDLVRRLGGPGDSPTQTARLKMAEVPEGAQVIAGDGFVPIVQMDNVVLLPGVPALMRTCFGRLAPAMRGTPFFGRALLLGCGESEIAAILTAAQLASPAVAIGSYPRFDDAPYRVKVTVDGRDQAAVDGCMARLRAALPAAAQLGEE